MLVLPLVDSTDVVSVVSSGAASDTSVSDAAVSDASVVSGVALSDTGVVSPHPVSNAADIINAEIIDNDCFLMVVILLISHYTINKSIYKQISEMLFLS